MNRTITWKEIADFNKMYKNELELVRHFHLEFWRIITRPSVYLQGTLIQIPAENFRLKPLLRHYDSEG